MMISARTRQAFGSLFDMVSLLRDNLTGLKAPELPPTSAGAWINSKPFTMSDKRGSSVLVDFWTYSCVNCLRTLPHLIRWHKLYAHMGLTILGVHSPEFEFEKDKNNVERFINRNGIEYPVVLDNDFSIWRTFSNHYWPRKLMIDSDGKVVYDHIGEGGYSETESKIRNELYKINPGIVFNEDVEEDVGEGGVCFPSTPELYCGFKRGRLGNTDSAVGSPFNYEDPLIRNENLIYLSGRWNWQPEYLRFEGGKGYLEIIFKGLEVNAVMESDAGALKIGLSLGDKSFEIKFKGRDVKTNGRSSIEVSNSRMYNIVASKEFITRKLKLVPNDKGFRIYAFTFGGCMENVAVPEIEP